MRLIFSLHWFADTLCLCLRDVCIARMMGENVCFSVCIKGRVYVNNWLLTKLLTFRYIFTSVLAILEKPMLWSFDFFSFLNVIFILLD